MGDSALFFHKSGFVFFKKEIFYRQKPKEVRF